MHHTRFWAFILACVVLCYGLFVGHKLLQGPSVYITTPENGETITTSRFTVSGTSESIRSIRVAGIPVLYYQDGSFSQEYSTPRGYYEIVVTGVGRFGTEVQKTVSIWGEPEYSVASSTTESETEEDEGNVQ